MSHSDPSAVARPATTDAERIARAERAEALTRGDAVLVGTVAGVVEWTDGAWTRLTGFPLVETVQKPITHFLERAGLERAARGGRGACCLRVVVRCASAGSPSRRSPSERASSGRQLAVP